MGPAHCFNVDWDPRRRLFAGMTMWGGWGAIFIAMDGCAEGSVRGDDGGWQPAGAIIRACVGGGSGRGSSPDQARGAVPGSRSSNRGGGRAGRLRRAARSRSRARRGPSATSCRWRGVRPLAGADTAPAHRPPHPSWDHGRQPGQGVLGPLHAARGHPLRRAGDRRGGARGCVRPGVRGPAGRQGPDHHRRGP